MEARQHRPAPACSAPGRRRRTSSFPDPVTQVLHGHSRMIRRMLIQRPQRGEGASAGQSGPHVPERA